MAPAPELSAEAPLRLLDLLLVQAYALPISMLGQFHRGLKGITLLLAGSDAAARVGAAAAAASPYLLGLGTGDITGPIVETNMGGYANLPQTDTGLHMRMRTRAFIVADAAAPASRVLFLNADICFGDSAVRRGIVDAVSAAYPGLYSAANIALVGTHQHSGVGGFMEYLLPQLTSLGYVNESASAIIEGSVRAVQRAHASLAPGSLGLGNTTIPDGNANRSPSAYLANPAAERAQYPYNTDKDFSLLRFNDASGNARGFLSFFAVHGTSIYENNTLVSTDNKGMAAYLYESMVEPAAMPGNATFVAGFAQSNVGDTTPNTLGAFCESPGKPYDGLACDFNSSTCGGATQDCHGRGPGFTQDAFGFASNAIIGGLQFNAAKSVMGGSLAPVTGPVASVQAYMNMSYRTFTLSNGSTAQTCPPALGYSFAAGTTDGPGAFDFIQGETDGNVTNPFWELVKGAITPLPPPEQVACQAPKPVLLDVGYAHVPYEWTPSVMPIQMLRVGQFVMIIMPGELTSMAGRRMRAAVRSALISQGVIGSNAYVVIAGPSNSYGHYITTVEEYGEQRYEGASTLFGPHTLEGYMDKYTSLVKFLSPNATGTVPSDPAPPEQTSKAISLRTGVIFDAAPLGSSIGDVKTDVNKQAAYAPGSTVSAVFVGADPRNNHRLEGTFLSVDHQAAGAWTMVRSDSHPSTTLRWNRTSTVLGNSITNISWTIESGTPAGTYRLSYYGDYKPLIGSITPFTGHSSAFTVSG